jgi:DNA polymerase-3 subunit epsilon
MLKFLWLDTETTGLDAKKNDIIQVAGIIETNDGGQEFNLRMAPFSPDNITQEAIDVHGISREKMLSYPDQSDTYLIFKKILKRYVNPYDKMDKFILSGQNVGFDSEMVKHWFLKNGDNYWFSFVSYAVFDLKTMIVLLEMTYGFKLFPNHKLSTVCKVMEIELEDAHDALADIRATRECCIKIWNLIRGKQNG